VKEQKKKITELHIEKLHNFYFSACVISSMRGLWYKAALGQVFSEYFGFPCESSFHQFLHHHNHPGLAQYAY
jgi:hypothetical protein